MRDECIRARMHLGWILLGGHKQWVFIFQENVKKNIHQCHHVSGCFHLPKDTWDCWRMTLWRAFHFSRVLRTKFTWLDTNLSTWLGTYPLDYLKAGIESLWNSNILRINNVWNGFTKDVTITRVGREWQKWFLPLVLTGSNRLTETPSGKNWQIPAKLKWPNCWFSG